MLATTELSRTIEFYERNLGFECRGKWPEGEPCWASIFNGDVEIAFSTPNAHNPFEKETQTGSIYLYVDGVEEIWEKLKPRLRNRHFGSPTPLTDLAADYADNADMRRKFRPD